MLRFQEVHDEGGILRVAELAGIIWREYYPSIIGLPQVDYMLAHLQTPVVIQDQLQNQGFEYFLLEDDRGNQVGYLAFRPEGDALFLSKLYLGIEYRGKGLSREMLAFVEGAARKKGCVRVTLTTHKRNAVALRAYEGLGFKIVEPVVTDIGDGYVMDDFRLLKTL